MKGSVDHGNSRKVVDAHNNAKAEVSLQFVIFHVLPFFEMRRVC